MLSNDHYYGLILAGGRGTRFWPRSRKARAKQVLPFLTEKTLIQETVERLAPLLPPERIWVLTNDHLRDEIVRQLPGVPADQIIAEPAQRNTAPAIGLAAEILRSRDPEAVLGVFPSDHLISDEARYLELVRPAFEAAEQGNIAVLGIAPRWAETGYGYVEFDPTVQRGSTTPRRVHSFREKPKAPQAEEYVKDGRFYWNAGMFFWKVETVLSALREHLPKTATLLASLPDFDSPEFAAALQTTYPKSEDISIDFAVLEKANNVVGIAADEIGWNDLGSWNAVYEVLPRDEHQNVVRGEALTIDSTGSYVDARGKIVALLGVKDLIVVDTSDALLIADRSRAQDVGKLVKELEQQRRDDLI